MTCTANIPAIVSASDLLGGVVRLPTDAVELFGVSRRLLGLLLGLLGRPAGGRTDAGGGRLPLATGLVRLPAVLVRLPARRRRLLLGNGEINGGKVTG